MKRGIFVLFMAVLTGALFAAGPIKVWFSNYDGMSQYAPTFGERFNAASKDLKVEVTVVPGTAVDFENKLNAAKMSGQAPDLVYIVLSSLAAMGVRGDFLDIGDYISTWSDRSDFLESALNVGKVGGKFVALGIAPAPIELVYRKDLFEKAGLDPNKPPKNWQELRAYAEKLTVKDAKGNITQTGFDMPTTDFFLNVSEPLLLMNGATVIDEVNMKPMLNQSEVAETLDYMYGFVKAGLTLPNDWQKKETMSFMNGNGAMAMLMVDNVKALVKNRPDLDGQILYAPPLVNKKASAFCGFRLLAIMKDSKSPDAAWQVMKAFTSSDEVRKRMDIGIVPIRKSLRDDFIKMNPTVNKVVMDTAAVGKGAFAVPWVNTLYKYWAPAFESVMQGKVKAADAMKSAQEQILAELPK
ncbi:MAG: extracellular solute-binding protein [Spirochaetota bacterium]